MRKKLISKTYLRDIRKYKIAFDISRDEYYVGIKYIVDGDEFVLPSGDRLIFNGSYMVEVVPKNEYYSMRAYLDEDLNIMEYYFDISLGNGLDEETKIPYYDDLYLDVGINRKGEIEVMDQNELDDALQDGKINKEEYDLAVKTCKKLVEELENGTNKYKNMDLKEIVNSVL